jgi:hypothetical protein
MSALTSDEMKRRALHLLQRVAAIRAEGGGTLGMEELLELTGVEADPDVRRKMEARGHIRLDFGADGSGRFANEGPAFVVPFGPVKLTVPVRVGGRVRMLEAGTDFDFDPSTTIVGKLLFMEIKLQRLEVSEHHVAVRMPGGAFDQEFRF